MRKDRRKRYIQAILCALLLSLSVATAALAGYSLWKSNKEYADGDAVYEIVSRKAHSEENEAPDQQEVLIVEDIHHIDEALAIPIQWETLKSINEATAAWLYCPDTVIDYPIVEAEDYTFYLTHLIDGTYNKNGTLFLEYNCAADFSDRLTIVYGHNMKSGKMLGCLVKYKDQAYYEAHPVMYLYTEPVNYRIELLYGFVIGAEEWQNEGYVYQEKCDALLEYAKAHTTFESGASFTKEDRFVAFSTCSYEFDDARYIVLGLLRAQ